LKNPLKLNGKYTQELQFYREIYSGADDLAQRRHLNDADEMEMERREKQNLRKMNKEFQQFVEKTEKISEELLKFDTP